MSGLVKTPAVKKGPKKGQKNLSLRFIAEYPLWNLLSENIPYNIQWMFPGIELDKTIQESLQSQNYQQRIIQII